MRNFSYSTTVDIIKAKGDNKNGDMLMKGVASTPSQDTQGDTLDPKGFELSYFLKSGLINWNHEWKANPMSIIGKPTAASVNEKNELVVEYYLFKGHKMAEEVYALAQAMQSNGLQLGLSIEGKVLEADPKNPKSIKRAMITDLAITPHPINQGTVTELAKGMKLGELIDFEAIGDFKVSPDGKLIVKAADTGSVEATIPESLDKKVKQPLIYKGEDGNDYDSEEEVVKAGFLHKGDDGVWTKEPKTIGSIKKVAKELFSKSEFTNLLLQEYSGTSEKDAESIFNYVSKYKQIKMSKETISEETRTVSTDDFSSALEALNSIKKSQETETIVEEEVIEAAAETSTETSEEETTGMSLSDMSPDQLASHKETLQKGIDAIEALTPNTEVKVEDTEAAATGSEEITEEVVEVAPVVTEEVVEEQSDLVKSLSTIIATNIQKGQAASDLKFEAVGTLIKGLQEDLADMKGETLEPRTVQTTEFVAKPGEILKSEETENLSGNTFSVATQKRALATKLTDVFLQKSEDPTVIVDEALRGDLMAFEAGSIITPRLQTFAKSEGISIIN